MLRGFCSPKSGPLHKIMRYWFYYSTQLGFHFHLINMIRWKCFVPQLYQFRRGLSGVAALYIFISFIGAGLIQCPIL